jgi:nucleotide-binding universal stress UspA family protein
MESVLIGYEPTPQGEDALALGGVFSEVLSARPMIVTALPFSSTAMGRRNLELSLSVDTAEMLAVARDRLATLQPTARAIASRSPAKGLAEVSLATDVAMMVIGSSHRGPLGHVVFGSTAERLLHEAPVPVAVAPRGFSTDGASQLHRLAVAYDGSAEAIHALETGIELSERTNGSLTLLHVVEPPVTGYGAFEEILLDAEGEEPPGKAILDEGLLRVPASAPADGQLLHGDAPGSLANAAKSFDLLIMGSRGRGPLLTTALGSVSGPLARKAPCPILVIPRGGTDGVLAGTKHAAARQGR